MMALVNIAFYRHRYGDSLCVKNNKDCGHRISGVKMDGTNVKVAEFTVDADDMIEAIKNNSWEPEQELSPEAKELYAKVRAALDGDA